MSIVFDFIILHEFHIAQTRIEKCGLWYSINYWEVGSGEYININHNSLTLHAITIAIPHRKAYWFNLFWILKCPQYYAGLSSSIGNCPFIVSFLMQRHRCFIPKQILSTENNPFENHFTCRACPNVKMMPISIKWPFQRKKNWPFFVTRGKMSFSALQACSK